MICDFSESWKSISVSVDSFKWLTNPYDIKSSYIIIKESGLEFKKLTLKEAEDLRYEIK